jgi:hypothetical protein
MADERIKKYGLGAIQQFDERSRNYPVKALLTDAPKKPRSYTWECEITLDQGASPSCVGHAFAHEMAARPSKYLGITSEVAMGLYKTAQTLDEWPGEDYAGTSIIAGVKATMQTYPGVYGGYRWGFGLDDLLMTLSYVGPCVLGINWHADSYFPDTNGLITPTGIQHGRHAILAKGIAVKRKLIRIQNSWGPGWGKGGDCFISFDAMDQLLRAGGECCVPLSRKRMKR